MHVFSEMLDIEAPDGVVYDVIADLSAYSEWNPWIVAAQGEFMPGKMVQVKMHMFGRERVFDHRILTAQRPHALHWCDSGWFTALAFGDRIRSIEAIGESRCRYRVDLRIKGVAAGLTRWMLGGFLEEGLRRETVALKARAETRFRRG